MALVITIDDSQQKSADNHNAASQRLMLKQSSSSSTSPCKTILQAITPPRHRRLPNAMLIRASTYHGSIEEELTLPPLLPFEFLQINFGGWHDDHGYSHIRSLLDCEEIGTLPSVQSFRNREYRIYADDKGFSANKFTNFNVRPFMTVHDYEFYAGILGPVGDLLIVCGDQSTLWWQVLYSACMEQDEREMTPRQRAKKNKMHVTAKYDDSTWLGRLKMARLDWDLQLSSSSSSSSSSPPPSPSPTTNEQDDGE